MFLIGMWNLSGRIESCYPNKMPRPSLPLYTCWQVNGVGAIPSWAAHQRPAGESRASPANSSLQLPMEALSTSLQKEEWFHSLQRRLENMFPPLSPKHISFQKIKKDFLNCSFTFSDTKVSDYLLVSLFVFLGPHLAYGSSQVRGWTGAAAAASLYHSHSNVGSKPPLGPIPQLMAMSDP